MATFAQILSATTSLISHVDKIQAILTGPATGEGSEVEVTEDLTLPTFAKFFADLQSPETVTADFITLEDQTGFTIPDNSLGQKAGRPYYGNVPLTDGKVRIISSTASGVHANLVEFPIAASDMVHNKLFWLDLDLSIFQQGTVGNFQTTLMFDFLNDCADDQTTGFYIDTGPYRYCRLRYCGLIQITTGGGSLGPELNDAAVGLGMEFIGQAADGSNATVHRLADSPNMGAGGTSAGNVPNVANTLAIRLLYSAGSTITTVQTRGHATLTAYLP